MHWLDTLKSGHPLSTGSRESGSGREERAHCVLYDKQLAIVGGEQDVHDAVIVKVDHDWCRMHLALMEGWPEVIHRLCPIGAIHNLCMY